VLSGEYFISDSIYEIESYADLALVARRSPTAGHTQLEGGRSMSLITISTKIGSQGSAIAAAVAEVLNLTLYDNLRLQKEALNMGVANEKQISLTEKTPGFLDRLLSQRPEANLDLMESIVLEVAKRGEGVIVGHLSQMLLRDFDCALHILIHASKKTRIQNLMHKLRLSYESAEKLLEKKDNEQEGFFRFAFHGNLNDPSLYDLAINSEKFSQETAVRTIVELAGTDEIHACSLGALEAMERLARIKAVEAELLKHSFNLSMINVSFPAKDTVRINGLAPTDTAKEEVLHSVRKMPGITEVIYDVSVMPPDLE
jgi:cytidylate kinase